MAKENPFIVAMREESNRNRGGGGGNNRNNGGGGGGGNRNGGGGGGGNDRARERVRELAEAGTPLADIKDTRAAGNLSPDAVRNIFARNTPIESPRVDELRSRIDASRNSNTNPFAPSAGGGGGGGGQGNRNTGGGQGNRNPGTFTGNPSQPVTPFDTSAGGGAPGGTNAPAGELATIFENLTTAQENLSNIQGGFSVQAAQIGANASVAAAGLRADADKEVARAYADAQKFSSERGLEGTKYVADRESEWRQAVANIEVKGRLDLQPIINAGIQRVAEIEGLTQRDVADITGRFNLASTKARTDADERISKVQLAGNLYGLINSVFG